MGTGETHTAGRTGPFLKLVRVGAGLLLALVSGPVSGAVIAIDFSHDTNGLFSPAGNPTHYLTARAAVEAAGTDLSAAITSTLAEVSTGTSPSVDSIAGSAGSTTATLDWDARYTHPNTGASETIASPTPGGPVGFNTVTVFAGSRLLSGSTLGQGGPGGAGFGLGVSGFESELNDAIDAMETASNSYMTRGGGPTIGTIDGSITLGSTTANYSLSYGSLLGNLWFDADTDNDGFLDSSGTLAGSWHFDHTTAVAAGKSDLYSVAIHEMAHAIGFGTSESWDGDVSGTVWTGAEANGLYGGSVPLSVDLAHIDEGITGTTVAPSSGVLASGGVTQEALMDPTLTVGARKILTDLDLAMLEDIGWSAIPEPGLAVPLLLLAVSGAWLRRPLRRVPNSS